MESVGMITVGLMICMLSLASFPFAESYHTKRTLRRLQQRDSSSFDQRLVESSVTIPGMTATTSVSNGVMGLNVQDFGCLPGGPSCGPQFQQAVEAAMAMGRALLLPAGVYNVNQTIQIPQGKGPLSIRGEGKYLSEVVAANDGMFAVFNISWNGVAKEGTHIDMKDFIINAAARAQYGIYAPGLTRSYFNRLNFFDALTSGFYHGGWIDIINECSFNGNHFAGLQMGLDSNNVVVDSCSFEGNPGMGIFISGGTQISILNNVIEGNGAEGIFTNAVNGLALRSNYFEDNQTPGPRTLPFGVNSSHGGNLTYYADIVLNGNGDPLSALDAAFPNNAVEMVGNTFCPDGPPREVPNVGFLLAAVNGGVMNSNKVGCIHKLTSLFLVSTTSFFSVRNLKISGNEGVFAPTYYQPNFPSGFYLHQHNLSFTSPHLGFELHPLPVYSFPAGGQVDFGLTSTSLSQAKLAYFGDSGVDLHSNFESPTSRRMWGDSANITMQGQGKGPFSSNIYGRQFPPIVDTGLNKLPVQFTIPVRCFSNSTVVSLVYYPGYGAPTQRSSDWFMNPADGWVDLTIVGELHVPIGSPVNNPTPFDGPAVGIQLTLDNTVEENPMANIGIGKDGYFTPLGAPRSGE